MSQTIACSWPHVAGLSRCPLVLLQPRVDSLLVLPAHGLFVKGLRFLPAITFS